MTINVSHSDRSREEAMGDPFAPDPPDLQDVLDALDDTACHTIIEHLERPMTAAELSEACDIPESTMYRKLDLLSDASLVDEQIEVRSNGQHTTRYTRNFDAVRIELDEDRTIDLDIERRSQSPDEQLVELWSDVRSET
ncbi:Helix-turn-helix domain-containing protein [Haloplanus vescus]|uniref:Helix-turn-helix domain-containing protein n=1 Tax=Haloplanus vescus TaxID=555874 RepID=A0A1H3W8J2_9EURY|nr:Helix-turn-helix domain-containing protein [Haloplanus vescus]